MKVIECPQVVEAPVLSPERQRLWDAANYMEQRGWCQRAIENARGNVCLIGAINSIGDYDDAWSKAWDLLYPKLGVSSISCAVLWNNAPGRTKAEVVAALRSAALS